MHYYVLVLIFWAAKKGSLVCIIIIKAKILVLFPLGFYRGCSLLILIGSAIAAFRIVIVRIHGVMIFEKKFR